MKASNCTSEMTHLSEKGRKSESSEICMKRAYFILHPYVIQQVVHIYGTVEALDAAAPFGHEVKGDLREHAGDIMTYIPELPLVRCWHVQTSPPQKSHDDDASSFPLCTITPHRQSVTTILCLPAATAATVTLLFVHLKPPYNSFHAKKKKKMQQRQD